MSSIRKKGKELVFVKRIDNDGLTLQDVDDSYINILQEDEFEINCLSITNRTFIASGMSSFVVKLKQSEQEAPDESKSKGNFNFAIWYNTKGYDYGHVQHLKNGDMIIDVGDFDRIKNKFKAYYDIYNSARKTFNKVYPSKFKRDNNILYGEITPEEWVTDCIKKMNMLHDLKTIFNKTDIREYKNLMKLLGIKMSFDINTEYGEISLTGIILDVLYYEKRDLEDFLFIPLDKFDEYKKYENENDFYKSKIFTLGHFINTSTIKNIKPLDEK